MNPLISIIIPVHNRQKELEQSLDSVVKQTYRPLEVIVVDDGSSEEIRKLGNREIKGTSEINFQFFRQENKGAPVARNKGFELSKGEYVIFWDSDTIAQPEMLEKMYQTLSHHRDAQFVYSNHIHAGKIKFRARAFDVAVLKKNNYINTMSLMRREAFPGWDESLKRFQDWDLFLTMALQRKKGIWIDEFLYSSLPTKTGMSYWLPSFAYKSPWKYFPFFSQKVRAYEEAKKRVMRRHGLLV